jgi:hypothetical protein
MRFTLTSGVDVAEVVDRPESARAALKQVLALLARKRNDVHIFDEDGRRLSPADLCRPAVQEVAMLFDESRAELLSRSRVTPAHFLPVDRRYLVATLDRPDAPLPPSAF